MNDVDRRARNTQRLTELFPTFASRVSAIIASLEAEGLRPRIQDAWRNPEAQLKAFQSGHSKLKFGFHNVTGPNGEKQALAVDLLDDDHAGNEGAEYLLHVAARAEANGCTTGIRWGMPRKLAAAIDDALAAGDWTAPVKVGWDPTHIQPADLTVADARAGQRPA